MLLLFPKNVIIFPKKSAEMTDIRFVSTKQAAEILGLSPRIMEFKAVKEEGRLSAGAGEALRQIELKHYDTDLRDREIKDIVKYVYR